MNFIYNKINDIFNFNYLLIENTCYVYSIIIGYYL